MDIFNRPPSISEDTLQYALYPSPQSSDKASVTSLAACIRDYLDGLLQNFIWHRDAFELKTAQDDATKNWFLEGRMRVGDSVDDEWCTVWLFREISAKWDLVISAYDSDGEFLLIEAADELPSWVKPSNAENRVWIYNSRLHLIPLSHVSPPSRTRRRRKYADTAEDGEEVNNFEDDDEYLAPEDGVALVRSDVEATLAPAKVEAIVWRRISGYPAALREHLHTTKAYVPTDVAKALLAKPSLVQKAVEAFYTRDAIQLRAAHRMSRFPPSTSVLRSVKMTRTAYAQLMGQKFFPPKIFGQWRESEGNREYKWRDIGMKIAVGFEMLYQESKGRSTANEAAVERSKAEANKEALRRNSEYTQYIQNLVSTGYFKGEKEGSQLWTELETKAANAFLDIRSSNQRLSFSKQVESAITKAASIGDPGLQEEDDEAWLTIDAQDFETKLEQVLGQTNKPTQEDVMDVDSPEISEENRLASEQASRLKDLASKVEQFVEGEGDIEGAQFSDEDFSDEPLSDGDSDEDSGEEDSSVRPLSYANGSTATKEAMDNLVPSLGPDEYGKMPASFYANSQKVTSATIATDVVEETRPDANPKSQDRPSEFSTKPIRAPILQRDKYEGVDSDDETDEEDGEDDESEEDMPQVLGDVEIDMEEEEEEFLEFSRQALGISDEQWNDILQERKNRGAFVPKSAKKATVTSGAPTTKEQSLPKKTAPAEDSGLSGAKKESRVPQPGPRPNVNPELDSFEAVMNAMDAELSRLKTSTKKHKSQSSAQAEPSRVDKGKGKQKEEADEDEDIEAAMEAELKAAMERGDDEDDEDDEMGEGGSMDYNLIKNFLESFKSQAGLSGPVDLMIHAVLIFNTSGVARLTKFYTPLHQSSQTLIQKIFSLVISRPATLCNFLDAPELEAYLGPKTVKKKTEGANGGGADWSGSSGLEEDEKWRVVYRNYATLYFVFVVDGAESELGILDLIQVFVESLDRAFENVCELDLVFHFDEVHHILSEIIQGGLVLETNVEEIDAAVALAAKLRKESFASANPLASLGSGGARGGNLKTPLEWLTGKFAGVGAR
ncbi:hypothetical protein NP233_g625 [Leucocoprinus birnbaumii]|uniref:AP complex mu/sigma subunit domain-containing protein n=1 Tax=Leucocoprinus birnbaumii TaxID=56174 RepID=A0AAD5W3T5_9AGAR|nr:hypothetical protein NP233_g625 [Leucocoprinus birnbaumii]